MGATNGRIQMPLLERVSMSSNDFLSKIHTHKILSHSPEVFISNTNRNQSKTKASR